MLGWDMGFVKGFLKVILFENAQSPERLIVLGFVGAIQNLHTHKLRAAYALGLECLFCVDPRLTFSCEEYQTPSPVHQQ